MLPELLVVGIGLPVDTSGRQAERRPLTILEEDVEQDDADLVICADVCVEQDGHDGPHGVFDLLSFSVCAHRQILQQEKGFV